MVVTILALAALLIIASFSFATIGALVVAGYRIFGVICEPDYTTNANAIPDWSNTARYKQAKKEHYAREKANHKLWLAR